jgi:hypothetical protein
VVGGGAAQLETGEAATIPKRKMCVLALKVAFQGAQRVRGSFPGTSKCRLEVLGPSPPVKEVLGPQSPVNTHDTRGSVTTKATDPTPSRQAEKYIYMLVSAGCATSCHGYSVLNQPQFSVTPKLNVCVRSPKRSLDAPGCLVP